ncbi:glycosyltransferase family 2 protein [Citrobacter youngae]|uniref:glycosyltransferase family 2 protein n=1 Tax=Citrobacter youngae TaxID=133448 RepID=UPI003B986309
MQVTVDGVHYAPVSITNSRIGIAISTHNRPDVLIRALEQHLKHLPAGALVVVIDDGSKPAATVPDGVQLLRKRTARTVLTGTGYSVGRVIRQGNSSLT